MVGQFLQQTPSHIYKKKKTVYIYIYSYNYITSSWQFLRLWQFVPGQPRGTSFCIVMAVVLHIVVSDARLVPWASQMRQWLYVDDWVVQARLEAAVLLIEAMAAAIAAQNMALQLPKCAFHVTALTDSLIAEWPAYAAALSEMIPHRPEGLLYSGPRHAVTLRCP